MKVEEIIGMGVRTAMDEAAAATATIALRRWHKNGAEDARIYLERVLTEVPAEVLARVISIHGSVK
jgi:hypothetical protein